MDNILAVIKSISDRNRLRILSALLVYDELCACQITELLQVAGATASRHLGLMVNAGVLKNRRQGRWIYFRLNRERQSLLPLFQWVKEEIQQTGQAEKDRDALKAIRRIPCDALSRKQRQDGTCTRTEQSQEMCGER